MADPTKLELDFEILTLTNNIETMNRLGKSAIDLQNRLNVCRAKLQAMKSGVDAETQIGNNNDILSSS
jgi:hypothetical protein